MPCPDIFLSHAVLNIQFSAYYGITILKGGACQNHIQLHTKYKSKLRVPATYIRQHVYVSYMFRPISATLTRPARCWLRSRLRVYFGFIRGPNRRSTGYLDSRSQLLIQAYTRLHFAFSQNGEVGVCL